MANLKESADGRVKGITSSLNIELSFKEAADAKGYNLITDIKMPIIIPAMDLATNEEVIFTNRKIKGERYINDIEIAKAIRASSTVPGIYSPFKYKNYQFIDGGVCDNLPVREVKKIGNVDKIIGIKFNIKSKKQINTMYNIVMQSVDLMTETLIKEDVNISDYILNIDLKSVHPFNIKKIDFCYEEGYKQTMENMDGIKKALETITEKGA